MISFRNHVVSLLAVFLALAIGIVLGGGPMSAVGRGEDDRTSSTRDTAALESARAEADYAEELNGSLAARAYDDGLSGTSVAVLSFPGAASGAGDDLAEQIEAAGGTVAGRYELLDALTAPGEKTLVDSLGSQLSTQNKGIVAEGSSTYDRIGQLLGRAVATDQEEPARVDGTASTLAESLSAADLLRSPQRVTERAPYVVLLLGDDRGEQADPAYEGIIAGLARSANGVVVAGTAADGRDGLLSRLRDTSAADDAATVDGLDRTSGVVTTVLALTAWPESRGGAFGASGSDGAVPIG